MDRSIVCLIASKTDNIASHIQLRKSILINEEISSMRRRNALLDALETLKRTNPDFTVNQVMALLHIADDEAALPLPDLRRRAGMTGDVAWKSVQALCEMHDEHGAPLVAVDRWRMGVIVAAELGAGGARLCERIDEILRVAEPIRPPAWRRRVSVRARASGSGDG
jgi:hypothetical protein